MQHAYIIASGLNRLTRLHTPGGPLFVSLLVTAMLLPGCGQREVLSTQTQVSTMSLGGLSAEYEIALIRAEIHDLQTHCTQQRIHCAETQKADSLYRSSLGKESPAARGDFLLRLDHVRTLYELAIARNQLRLKEDAVVRLEENLQTFREIVGELESIGRK